MNHCKVSIWILFSLISICIFSLIILKYECKNYLSLTEQIQEAVQTGDTAQALSAFDRLEQNWKQYHDISGVFVNGSELDSIREIMSGLRPLIENQHPEVSSELLKMQNLILSVYEEEIPELWHIL
jgi:hypothetical protein